MKKFFLLITLAITVMIFASCGHNTSNSNKKKSSSNDSSQQTNASEEITYKNDKYGFTLIFPGSWKDKYYVTEADNQIVIRHKGTWLKDKAGALFTIVIFNPKSKWDAEGKALQEEIGMKKIFEDNSQVYGFYTPTDVQYIPDDKKLSDEYKLMEDKVYDIIKSFKKIN